MLQEGRVGRVLESEYQLINARMILTSEDLALIVAPNPIRCVLPDISWGRRPQHRTHDILFLHKCSVHTVPNIQSTMILSTTSRSRRTASCLLTSLYP